MPLFPVPTEPERYRCINLRDHPDRTFPETTGLNGDEAKQLSRPQKWKEKTYRLCFYKSASPEPEVDYVIDFEVDQEKLSLSSRAGGFKRYDNADEKIISPSHVNPTAMAIWLTVLHRNPIDINEIHPDPKIRIPVGIKIMWELAKLAVDFDLDKHLLMQWFEA
jgi:hypothetical protein